MRSSGTVSKGHILLEPSSGARFHLVPFILRVLPDCTVCLLGWNPTDRRLEI